MTILSDLPTGMVDEDLLGLESRLSAVLDIMRFHLTKCPISIAIYGDWGTGKTSAMRWLECHLKTWNEVPLATRTIQDGEHKGKIHPRVHPVWFDPWKYHTREDVWRGIISEVILALFDTKNLTQQDLILRMKEAAKKFGAFLGKGFLHALASTEFKIKAGAIATGMELSVKGEMFREIYEEFDKANYPEKAYLNQFETTLRAWVGSFLKDGNRIALFIDDLDRSLPEVTLEVLEAIKLYLNIPQIIFVVGLDRAVVDAVVRKHYGEQGVEPDKAEKYLDKIFQVEVQVSPSQTQMGDFHKQQIAQLDAYIGGYWKNNLIQQHQDILEVGISDLAKGNPRELKRLLNSALMRGRAAVDNPALKKTIAHKQLFAQGVQLFLIQKVVEKRYGRSSTILLKTSVLNWLQEWSAILQLVPGYRPAIVDEDATKKMTATEEVLRAKKYEKQGVVFAALDKADKQYEKFKKSQLHDDGKSVDKDLLLKDDLMWELLAILFSVEVAQSAPILEPVKPAPEPVVPAATVPIPVQPDILSTMSDGLRGRIAKALDKPVDKLVAGDLSKVKKLDLGSLAIKPTDLDPLIHLSALQELKLYNTDFTDMGMKSLEKLTSLQRLFVSGYNITDAGLKSLEELTTLKWLSMVHTGITDAGLKSLEKLTALEWLHLGNNGLTDAGLKSLEKLTALEDIYLNNTKTTDVGKNWLKTVLPKVSIH